MEQGGKVFFTHLAVGIVLPIFTGQIPQIVNMLLPMHLSVIVCGLICGWQYGCIVGFLLPLLRYVLFAMPPMPNGLAMAFELAAYRVPIPFSDYRYDWGMYHMGDYPPAYFYSCAHGSFE